MKASLANVEKALLAVCAALLTLVAQAAPSDAGAAAGYPPENFRKRNLQHLLQYADDVGATTGGQVRLTLNTADSLIEPAEIFDAVRNGGAETGEVIMSRPAKENPLFRIESKGR